jgi:alanine dehydrogenase
MIIGVPKETGVQGGLEERRVSLSPAVVSELTGAGVEVVIERGAGERAHFPDEDYREAGASIVYSKEEAYRRADMVVKVQVPQQQEWNYIREKHVLVGCLFPGIAPREFLEILLDRHVTAIGMELVLREDGTHPLQRPMSKIAGKMAPQIAGRLLQSNIKGGRGILLGGMEGIPSAEVVILGAGTLGASAARSFAGLGCSVYLVDKDIRRLEYIMDQIPGRVTTVLYTQKNLSKLVTFADVLLCAVQVPGERTPVLVSREMVRSMRKGSVLLDFSVDQGGAAETTRPTPNEEYAYIDEGVIHFAVPNVPSWVPRTASHALSNALLPYLFALAADVRKALRLCTDLRAGVCTYDGFVTNLHLPHDMGSGCRSVDSLVEES